MITEITKNTIQALALNKDNTELINYIELCMKLEYNRGLQEGLAKLTGSLEKLELNLKKGQSNETK